MLLDACHESSLCLDGFFAGCFMKKKYFAVASVVVRLIFDWKIMVPELAMVSELDLWLPELATSCYICSNETCNEAADYGNLLHGAHRAH